MITPTRDRLLVKMLGAYDGIPNPLGLKIVDQERHWRHKSRKCKVLAAGPKVEYVAPGDVVIISGEAGKTLDGVGAGLGEEYRWLVESDCLAAEESESVSKDTIKEP